MKKIRIGNDFVFNWAIERGGLAEDLSSVLEKHLHLSVFGKRVELVEGIDYDITGNVIRIEVTPTIANILGTYKAEFHYILPDNGLIDEDRKCAVDVDAFQIVAKTAQADDSTEFSMTSDMAIAFKGDKGDPGVGIPIGGVAGQQLTKKSATDYDFEWQTPACAGDMLKSVYDSDGNGVVDNAEKVNNHTVDADVPAGAKFTDTIYTHPATHPYSMITGAPTSLPANGGDSATVNGKTVEENVPAGAKFTDTIYVHPTSDGNLHVPATGTTNDGKVLKAGATAGSLAWGTDNDTITTINGKTGTITKADIVALGIPAQDTVYTHPAGTNPHGTTKADVGLGNVDNVKQIPFSEKGANGGVAELDLTGKVLSSQLPSYVDDVLEYATSANFPTTGEAGKIYIAINTNLTYRWTGTAYTEISPSIALGETSATAYRGDRGKIAYDHSQVTHAPSNAQKNSDITKAEIEAKLTGAITSHTHAYASTSHTHNATDINAGTFAIARIPTGTTSSTVALGNHTHSDYVPTSRTVAGKALTGNITLAKGDVGLGNVDNTSDANKPVSTAQQTALNAKIDSNKFQVVASLPASPVSGTFYFVKE